MSQYIFSGWMILPASQCKVFDKQNYDHKAYPLGIGLESPRTTMFDIVLKRNKTHGERWARRDSKPKRIPYKSPCLS